MFGNIPEGVTQAVDKPPRQRPALVLEHGCVCLEMERDQPNIVQNVRIIVQSWRANADSALEVDRNVDRIIRYITSYMCKGTATTKELVGEWKNIGDGAPPDAPLRSLASRLAPKAGVTKDLMASEMAHHLSGGPMYRTSQEIKDFGLSGAKQVDAGGTEESQLDRFLGVARRNQNKFQTLASYASNDFEHVANFTGCWPIPTGWPCEKYAKFVLMIVLPGSWSSNYDLLLWEPTYSAAVG